MLKQAAALVFTGLVLGVWVTPAGAQSIVFASDRDGTYDIWQMNPDGTGQVKLAGSPTVDEFSPAASADGTKIAFVRGGIEGDLMIMNADGTGERFITHTAQDPSWSPGGDRLAFGSQGHGSRDGQIWIVNADGTGEAPVAAPGRDNAGTSWSADDRIAFHAQLSFPPSNDGIWWVSSDGNDILQLTQTEESLDSDPDWSPNATKLVFSRGSIWSVNPDGSAETSVTSTPDGKPAWAPDGSAIAFRSSRDGNEEIYKMNPDGSGQTRLTNNPASDTDPDWLPLFAGYARPKGATPLRASLAIAYDPCTAPNRTHGPPLAFASCGSPQQASDFLTVGTADANAKPALNEGDVRLTALPGIPGGADDADVAIEFFMDDVFTKPSLGDYAGSLRTQLTIRLTDRDLDGSPPTGTTEVGLAFDSPCSPVADPQEGSSCTLATTADAIVPGAVREGKRAIWALGRIEVYDGGADGNGATADNTLLATQGVFIP